MGRFGSNPERAIGVRIPKLRAIAKEIGKNHTIAVGLWRSNVHEAMILATMIDDPSLVTEKQMNSWVKDFNSWDLCDQCCGNLFDRTVYGYKKALEWSKRDEEYVKRAGFATMAYIAVHDKQRPDSEFLPLLKAIERGSDDNRNFVRKAVNWALREIGKRNIKLNKIAIRTAKRVYANDSAAARWIANDALRELTGKAVKRRLNY